MKTRAQVERRLEELERALLNQLEAVRASEKGFGGPESLFWDGRLVERHALRWVLGKRRKPFCNADVMAGW